MEISADVARYLRQYQRVALGALDYNRQRKKRHEPQKAIYHGHKRKHVIDRIVSAMSDWRVTPFENEGTFVAGVRSTLCMQGHPWAVAHSEASALVNEALRSLGAKRPTWEEGQRNYVTPHDQCAWCDGPIDANLMVGHTNGRFCSSECARAAITHRNLSRIRKESRVFHEAWNIIQRTRNKEIACEACGKQFRPLFAAGRFCSRKCIGGRPKRDWPERTCLACGIIFKCKRPDESERGKFCSVRCSADFGSARRYERNCVVCTEPFVAKAAHGKCCTQRCATFYSKIKAGQTPKRITPLVFDYYFLGDGKVITVDQQLASNVIYLTVEHFDRMFRGRSSEPEIAAEIFDKMLG